MPSPRSRSARLSDAAARRVKVMLPLPLAESYDYRLPAGLDLAPGQYVSVPLGSRTATGIVWETDVAAGPQAVAEARLKDVEQALDVPPMPAAMRRFIEWVADYTLSPPGSVLRMAMSVPAAFAPPRPRVAYRLAAKRPDIRLTPARGRVLALLSEGPPRVPSELQREAGVGGSVLRGLVDAGAVEAVLLPAEPSPSMPDPDRPGAALSPAQGAAAADLAARVESGGFSVALLDGVTGSGKTEVYFEAIAAALQSGRQVLVMLPEIALSAQWLERFAGRFGTPPVEWHSDLTQARRRAAWRAVAEGRARVVVGARSALFLPFPELGLIVVDEEHDSSFKQEDGVIYHARDMAVVRARIEAVPIVLVSATPSLESMVNGAAGRYDRLHLPARHGEAELPEIVVVDLRRDAPDRQSWLSPSLKKALVATLAAGEQALLFLNRRGYAPLTLCRACGHRLQCPNCTAWLVEHRLVGYLECHHCGHRAALPQICPECGTEGRMAACGPGVERLAEEVAALHPEARLGVLTSDTIQGPTAAAAFLRQVRDHQVDILIGTQIVAKGHHFPMLTLVGVVDADLGLAGGDLRAGERTYQLLSQVAGRAGREERPGLVLLQTWHPDHPVMTALRDGDRDRFLGAEAAAREAGGWPPYGRLAAVIVSGPDIEQVDRVARELGRAAPRGRDVHVLGPAPAPLALLRGRHRRRLLLKAARAVRVQPLLRDWLSRVHAPSAVRVQVDIDPYSFL